MRSAQIYSVLLQKHLKAAKIQTCLVLYLLLHCPVWILMSPSDSIAASESFIVSATYSAEAIACLQSVCLCVWPPQWVCQLKRYKDFLAVTFNLSAITGLLVGMDSFFFFQELPMINTLWSHIMTRKLNASNGSYISAARHHPLCSSFSK